MKNTSNYRLISQTVSVFTLLMKNKILPFLSVFTLLMKNKILPF